MDYWKDGFVQDLALVIGLLALAAALRHLIKPLGRVGIPDCLIAGAMGMIAGPTGLGWLPFSTQLLEMVIYHLLAIVFIAVTLQTPPKGSASGSARSIAFAIPAVAVLQCFVGMLCVWGWNVAKGGPELHTGFAMLVPLGYNQGPGQAMSLGGAWEQDAGFEHGAQLGLIIATSGLFWCCIFGIALVAWGRHKGWDRTRGPLDSQGEAGGLELGERVVARVPKFGELEPLTVQIVVIALIYLATWLILDNLGPSIPDKLRSTWWGFHFLIASFVAMAVRPLIAKLPPANPLDDDLLGRIGNTSVDIATCAAIAAVKIQLLQAYLGPILIAGTLAGIVTTWVCIWMARRAFPVAPFAHAVITWGSLTGTTATGLALLRMLDPQLDGPAARNYVLSVAPSALLGMPLFLLMQRPVLGFPGDYPSAMFTTAAMLLAYLIVLVVLWRLVTPLRFTRPLWRLWPDPDTLPKP
jgi:ESS family glutamate:Na+ symporter